MLERTAEVRERAGRLDPAAREKLLSECMAQNVVRVLNAQAAAEADLVRAGT
jgi:hypothetical protein